ncbi:sulfatase-like hydrolase/transferase, partial [Singulisphaera rosea]
EARAPAPWTAPTHGSLMTGRWPHELSVAPNIPLDATDPTVAEVLGRQGYATAGFVGNLYYCNALFGFDRGFGRYEDAYENRSVTPLEVAWSSGLGRRLIACLGSSTTSEDLATLRRKSAEMINRDVFQWLSKAPQDRPFFVFLNYYDAHRPYVLPDGPQPRFGKSTLPIAEQLEIDRRFHELSAQGLDAENPVHRQINADSLELCHDSYDTAIAYLDRQVGLLLDGLEAQGRLDNTLVIITSDHGEELGERGMVTHGASLYRPEVHVPLLILPPYRSPMPPARVVDTPVSLRDIPATIASWAVPSLEGPFPGHSLFDQDSDNSETRRAERPVLSELQHNIAFPDKTEIPSPFGAARSVVANGRVYIRRVDGAEELYDLKSDPLEAINLAKLPECRDEVQDFRKTLERLR